MEELKSYKRKLPHWTQENAIYFITFTLTHGTLTDSEKEVIFNHLKEGNNKFYILHSMVVMHDHVHILLQCNSDYSLIRLMRGIKGVTAHKINKARNSKGKLWMVESYDRIIRDEKEYNEKMVYMFNNPLKKDLVDDPEKYKWWFINEELSRFG
jgi:REP element-mobilizing transposase RayT